MNINHTESRWDKNQNEGGDGYNPYRQQRTLDKPKKADAARMAKYHALSCHHCGDVYAVDMVNMQVREHNCENMTADQMLGI